MRLKFVTSFLLLGLLANPALSQTSNPFANMPKASDFLGSPSEFVQEVEDAVMPILIQFFSGVAAIYSLAQVIKAMKGPR